ncbi:class I SAM-dependent methyltransferase [Streptomyces sp. NPDC127098]|uniref:class I SAM-dependent methyltransferase n=1 Tax=Streptomyces sp. NPDC127098 TaxID=3347137 RepID=UPI00365B747F
MAPAHAHYDEKLASVYDQMYPIQADTDQAVAYLTRLLPAGGSLLELGVGNGRIALPLAERGYRVHGIDDSEAMLARLRDLDPHRRVTSHLGDFTETGTGERFDVVTLLMNTFFAAVTKEQQVSCLRRAAEQLAPGGKLVIQAFDPAPYHAMSRPEVSVRHLSDTSIMLDTLVIDRAQQVMVGVHTILDGGPPQTRRHVLRYAFPLEIDVLAELAGLRLADRLGSWTGAPYNSSSPGHVSVYVARPQ